MRGRSRAGAVRSGAVRAVAVRTGPNSSAQSRPKTEEYSTGVPTLDEHFSSSARQMLPKFSASLEEGASVDGRKNSEIWRGSFEKIGAKLHHGRKIQPPITPPNGGDPPQTKCVCTRVPRPIMCNTTQVWRWTNRCGLHLIKSFNRRTAVSQTNKRETISAA